MHKFENHHPSIDIIPLQGSSGDNKRKFVDMHRFRGNDVPNRGFRDEQILTRVQTYLYENEDKIYIDVNEMADYLQKRYRDYRNKKRGPFRLMVRRAYDEITECVTRKANPRWNEEDEEEVDIESDPQEEPLPTDLLKMYKKSGERRNGNSSDKELIDISSDDDNAKVDESPAKRLKGSVQETHKSSKKSGYPSTDLGSIQENQMSSLSQKHAESVQEKPTKKRQREKEIDNNSYDNFSKKKREALTGVPKVKFADIGGNSKILVNVCKSLLHVKHPELCSHFGKSPPRGFLLHGPPGCGKTLLAHAIAGELEMPFLKIAAPELVGGVSGESESRIRDLFDQAVALAPCVLFLDEVDAVAPHKATAQREMEKRIVSQLLLCLDGLESKENGNKVVVLGATSRPDALDPALRASGRFDREISLGIPDKKDRTAILAVHTAKLKLASNIDLEKLSSLTPGFVGADLVALITEAAMAAINRVLKDLKEKAVEVKDLEPIENVDKTIEIEKDNNSVEEVQIADNKEVEKSTAGSEENAEKLNGEEAKEAEIPADKSMASKPSTSNAQNDAIVIEEVAVEEDSESVQVEETRSASPQSQELSEMISWLHDNTQLTQEQLVKLYIEQEDFELALSMVQPSAKREGFVTVPDVTWDDIGSLQNIRQELYMSIIAPVKHSEKFAALGLSASTGVLLCGPPGCGKTLLAKAIANEAEINFISVKGPELLNMYVGESEKAVRQCFMRARNSAPCVIFFDELDALCPKRSEGDVSATSRVVNQMLTEMDGIGGRKGVFLMAASNRPDIIDPAVLRPGRLDKVLYVGLPNSFDRADILRALTKNGTTPKLAGDVNLEAVSNDSRCEGFTGADLAALVREAGVEALRELMSQPAKEAEVCSRHIDNALNKVRPSVHEKDMKYYDKLKKLYSVEKCNPDVTPMETPITMDAPLVDTTMEAMET